MKHVLHAISLVECERIQKCSRTGTALRQPCLLCPAFALQRAKSTDALSHVLTFLFAYL